MNADYIDDHSPLAGSLEGLDIVEFDDGNATIPGDDAGDPLPDADDERERAIAAASRDPAFIASLGLVNGAHPDAIRERIERALFGG